MKLGKLLAVLLTAVLFFGIFSGIRDKKTLGQDLIRFHVVADSNEPEAQEMKLRVRDAVLEDLRPVTGNFRSAEEAESYLAEHLPEIEETANRVLREAESGLHAAVSLRKEPFPRRDYDTFSLPSGIYESLRITIGRGEGKNWWCVVFPTLCVPAVSEDVADTAENAGFSRSLSAAVTGDFELGFWLLDLWGKAENWLWNRD